MFKTARKIFYRGCTSQHTYIGRLNSVSDHWHCFMYPISLPSCNNEIVSNNALESTFRMCSVSSLLAIGSIACLEYKPLSSTSEQANI